jgi:hypothetical protein
VSLPWHQRPPLNVRTKLDGMPTMLWREERLFLYHVARDLYQGRGEIVDLGAFLGGSAACFAAGLRDRRWGCDTHGRIHSFDLFEYAPHHAPFLPDFAGGPGASTLPVFWQTVAPYEDSVRAVAGDICRQTWRAPIEVLFVDFTQSWVHHDATADLFYRHLSAGSILIHQDYLYVLCYWLHIFMEFYAEYFEVIEPFIPAASAAWRVKAPLPDEALSVPLHRRLSTAAMRALLDRSVDRYRDILRGDRAVYLTLLRCARARFTWHHVGREEALEELGGLPRDDAHVRALAAEIHGSP